MRTAVKAMEPTARPLKAAIIQPNYLPWRGYFDIIDEVDFFILYDDVQFTKGDWRNRNRIKTPGGAEWLTVPVRQRQLAQLIRETRIDYSKRWVHNHINKIRTNYGRAPYFADYAEELFAILDAGHEDIATLDLALLRWCAAKLDIKTTLRRASEFACAGDRTERLIGLLEAVGASRYVSGPSAGVYLDERLFRRHGIGLEFKSYDYGPYPQLWGEFIADVSVIDLLFNTGGAARSFMKSATPNRTVL